MSLQGTFDTMPMEDLLEWLCLKERTGILYLQQNQTKKIIHINSGQVTNAASNKPQEYLGQFLLSFGLVTEDQLQKAFQIQQETKTMLGKVLVMSQAISIEQFHKVLATKFRESLLDVVFWEMGWFQFQPGFLPETQDSIPAKIMLEELFHEAVNRKKVYQKIRQIFPDNHCSLSCNQDVIPTDVDAKSADGMMLQMILQGLTPADIILRFHSLEFPVLKNLYKLSRLGWVAVVLGDKDKLKKPGTTKKVQFDLEKALQKAQAAIRRDEFEKAITTIKQTLALHPYDKRLYQALEESEAGHLQRLKEQLQPTKQVPHLLQGGQVSNTVQLNAVQKYLLSQVDSERTLQAIIQLSPLREIDALKAFQYLIQKGLIGLG